MADSASEYLRRFAAWRGGYVPPGQRPAAPPGFRPDGFELPAGAVAAVPADQQTLYLVFTGTGACWMPEPVTNPVTAVGANIWVGQYGGGRCGTCAFDSITLEGDSVATVKFRRLGRQVGPTLGLVNGVGGGAVGNCGCAQVTILVFEEP